jgi:hypothetical protein
LEGIEDALAGLPEQQRRAILLREWQGLSYREVAAELGLSQSAVEALIFRARRALAAALGSPAPAAVEPPQRRRRLLHALDAGALLASLKSAVSSGLSGGVATGVAVAASATLVVTAPLGRTLDLPRAEPTQPRSATVHEERARRPTRPDAADAAAASQQAPRASGRALGRSKAKSNRLGVGHMPKRHGHRPALASRGAGNAPSRPASPPQANRAGSGNAHGKG